MWGLGDEEMTTPERDLGDVGRGQKTAPGEARLDAWSLWRGNQACGEEIGAVLDEERKTSREELAAELRRLWAVVSETQTTIRDFHRSGRRL